MFLTLRILTTEGTNIYIYIYIYIYILRLSQVDYCNALYVNVSVVMISRLQTLTNTVTHIISDRSRFSNITDCQSWSALATCTAECEFQNRDIRHTSPSTLFHRWPSLEEKECAPLKICCWLYPCTALSLHIIHLLLPDHPSWTACLRIDVMYSHLFNSVRDLKDIVWPP